MNIGISQRSMNFTVSWETSSEFAYKILRKIEIENQKSLRFLENSEEF